MKDQGRSILKNLLDGISAGILISIGGAVFLAMLGLNKYVGAILFSVALLCICYKGYNLFTGKVGFMVEKHDKDAILTLFLGLAGNIIGTLVCGVVLSCAIPDLYTAAVTVCDAKVAQIWWQTLVRGLFCGVLMYLAVSIFKENKTALGILFCIPVFILSGFEHSIADMAYFATARVFTGESVLFLVMVVIGNAVGAMILPALSLITKRKTTDPSPAEEKDGTENG